MSYDLYQSGSDVQSTRAAATRIPVSKGMKTGKSVLGMSTVTRLESRAESQSMKIEVRKSAVCRSVSSGGGKSWVPHAAMETHLPGLHMIPRLSCLLPKPDRAHTKCSSAQTHCRTSLRFKTQHTAALYIYIDRFSEHFSCTNDIIALSTHCILKYVFVLFIHVFFKLSVTQRRLHCMFSCAWMQCFFWFNRHNQTNSHQDFHTVSRHFCFMIHFANTMYGGFRILNLPEMCVQKPIWSFIFHTYLLHQKINFFFETQHKTSGHPYIIDVKRLEKPKGQWSKG